MAITPAGDIFVTDGYGNRRIVHFDKNGKFVKEWGGYGNAPGKFMPVTVRPKDADTSEKSPD